ncbi:MAG TPA: alkaline phosphatase D family protein [Cyclobacteriaceae bacterium]|nr:alkaline phosphatase D family protein [Cyclobacteriaceae bacterium]
MNHLVRIVCFVCFIGSLLSACKEKEKQYPTLSESTAVLYDSALKPFYHGVASGDPLNDRVIIWTRVTPVDSVPEIEVQWQVAKDSDFSGIVAFDTITTSPARDYTVKVDVQGLEADQVYYYRFIALGKTSATGKTKTTPVNAKDSLKFAVVSCSNWEFGYFNAYSNIAEKEIDAVLHLGDYIYEYATGKYGDTTIGRINLPAHEIVSLQDYRTRHAQYRLDQGLRDVSKNHPFITIWDDHEFANNVYKAGAQNHQPDQEGDFEARKAAARQAYYEWLPIREGEKLYRSFSYGTLAQLIMLDERIEGREEPPATQDATTEERTMLGAEQLMWLEKELQSAATWKVIGNQVVYSDILQGDVFPNMPRNLDSWDGYQAEKKKIKEFILDNKISDVVFLTGDTHASWAFEVATDISARYKPFAVEFGTTSISSANDDEYHSVDTVMRMEGAMMKSNPHIKYLNDRDHGYLLLTLYPQKAKAEWFYVKTLREPDSRVKLGKKMEVAQGSYSLK